MTNFARRQQTMGEEAANSITHGIGTVLSIAGLTVMVVYAASLGDAYRIVAASVFGSTMVLLYLASTLYHSFQGEKIKPLLRRLDHSAIYLLIAGTYTPFTLLTMPGRLGWTLFAVVWGLAVAGIVFKVFCSNHFEIATTVIYVMMGWMGAVALKEVFEAISLNGTAWLVAGGLSYTVGVLFYVWRSLPFHHTVWHVFVMGGTFCHFFAVQFYVLPIK
jgi:hemolysin III